MILGRKYRRFLIVGVIILPLFIQLVFLSIYYYIEAPWVNAPKWLLRLSEVTSLFVGLLLLLLISFKRKSVKLLAILVYLPIAYYALLWTRLIYACAVGDCI